MKSNKRKTIKSLSWEIDQLEQKLKLSLITNISAVVLILILLLI